MLRGCIVVLGFALHVASDPHGPRTQGPQTHEEKVAEDTMRDGRPKEEDLPEFVDPMFARFDADGNGIISREDLEVVVPLMTSESDGTLEQRVDGFVRRAATWPPMPPISTLDCALACAATDAYA